MAETNGPLRRLESWVCALQRFVDVAVVIGAQALAHLSYAEPWNEQTSTATLVAGTFSPMALWIVRQANSHPKVQNHDRLRGWLRCGSGNPE
jgi:hypothetical protein